MSKPDVGQSAETVNPHYRKAADFVFSLPPKPVNVISIDPHGAAAPRPQTLKNVDGAAKWLRAQQADGRNLYLQDCTISVTNKRPKKNDVVTLHFAHADCEVMPKDTPAGAEYDRKRADLLKRLETELEYPPTMIINSGNGYQAYWMLSEPVKATDENIAQLEAVNTFFRDKFGGDACQDVAHLMRIPYTINFPNDRKKKLGRVKCVSSIVQDNRDTGVHTYPLDKLPVKTTAAVEAIKAETLSGAQSEYAKIGAPQIPERVDISRLSETLQRMITKGSAGNKIIGDSSRSDLIYHVACEMRRREYSDGQILSVITNPHYGISSHYEENKQRSIEDQAARVILRMNDDGVVAEADRRYKWDDECEIVIKPASFVDLKTRELVSLRSFDMTYGGLVGVKQEASKIGIHSRYMTRYAGLCYAPNGKGIYTPVEREGRQYFNTWRPQQITPLEEESRIFLEHMGYLIPADDERELFIDWLAHFIQHPEEKAPWAVILLGPHGTGKSWVAHLMRQLLGAHNCTAPTVDQIAGEFNSWVAEKILVIIHELKRPTRKGDLADSLKDLISEPIVRLNRKGIEQVDIENLASFLAIANDEESVMNIPSTERRWAMFRCADIPYGARPTPGKDPPYVPTPETTKYYERLWEGRTKEQIAQATVTPEARRVLWFLQRRGGGKVKLPILAPATEARSSVIETKRSDLEKCLRDHLLTKSGPFTQQVFNIPDVIASLPGDIPLRDRSQRCVEVTLKRLGCKALNIPAIDMGDPIGFKRLWARDGADASELRNKSNDDLVEMYRKGHELVQKAAAANEFGYSAPAPAKPKPEEDGFTREFG